MNKTLHVWPETFSQSNGVVHIEARLEIPNQESQTLWYQVPEDHVNEITHDHDPFILATLMLGMEKADKIHVHGTLSPSLLKNLEEYQQIWHCWLPNRYRLVEMHADIERESSSYAGPREVICAFSGGVDSAFTAWRHTHNLCGRRNEPLTAGLLVHGFDIPLSKEEEFNNACKKAEITLGSLDLQQRIVKTNFRNFGQRWEDVFATAIAATLHLFKGRFQGGLMGGGAPYKGFHMPFGSNPVSDHFLSSSNFPLITDGLAFTREEKLKVIADWPEILEHLRVCWEGPFFDRNCGHCEKCIRTSLLFRSLNINNPPCLPDEISNEEILNLTNLRPQQLKEPERIYHSGIQKKQTASWLDALKECIDKNRPKTPSLMDSLLGQGRNRIKWYQKSALNRIKAILK